MDTCIVACVISKIKIAHHLGNLTLGKLFPLIPSPDGRTFLTASGRATRRTLETWAMGRTTTPATSVFVSKREAASIQPQRRMRQPCAYSSSRSFAID